MSARSVEINKIWEGLFPKNTQNVHTEWLVCLEGSEWKGRKQQVMMEWSQQTNPGWFYTILLQSIYHEQFNAGNVPLHTIYPEQFTATKLQYTV